MIPAIVVGQTYSTVKDGDWNDPTVWSENSVPTSGNYVRISHDITRNGDLNWSSNSINIRNGGLLIVNGTLSFVGGGGIDMNNGSALQATNLSSTSGDIGFPNNGSVDIDNNLTVTNGKVDVGSNSSFNVGGNLTVGTTIYASGGSTFNVGGNVHSGGSLGIEGTGEVIGDVVVDTGGLSVQSGKSLEIGGTLTVHSGNVWNGGSLTVGESMSVENGQFTTGSYPTSVGGDLYVSNYVYSEGLFDIDGDFTADGNVSFNSFSLVVIEGDFTKAGNLDSGGQLVIAGDFISDGGGTNAWGGQIYVFNDLIINGGGDQAGCNEGGCFPKENCGSCKMLSLDSFPDDHPAIPYLENTDLSGAQPCPASSTVIWSEDFSSATGDWSIVGSGSAYSVNNNRMEINNNQQNTYWVTNAIDVSSYDNIRISIRAGQFTGSSMETQDYIEFYYTPDGGSTINFFETNGRLEGEFGTEYACADIGNATTLIIGVLAYETASDEYHFFDDVVVTGEPNMGISITSSQNVTCFGGNDGSATATVTGGAAPFTYRWTNSFGNEVSVTGGSSQNTNTVSNLPAGTYTVFVSDNNGLEDDETITINEPSQLNASISSSPASCGVNDGSITIVSPTGGSGNFEYSISGGNNWQSSATFSNLYGGDYDIQIRDASSPSCEEVLNSNYNLAEQGIEIPLKGDTTSTSCVNSTDGAIDLSVPFPMQFGSGYVDLGGHFMTDLSDFTMEGWIKVTGSVGSRTSVFGQNDAIEFGFNGINSLTLWASGGGGASTDAYPDDNKWHHIAVTGDDSYVRIYIDGVLVSTGGGHTGAYSNNSSFTTKIGAGVWDGSGGNFPGEIMKVGFWNYALSSGAIASLASNYNAYTGSESGLIAGYNFYEGAGSTLSSVKTGTDGSVSGSVPWIDNYSYAWTKSGDGSFSATSQDVSGLATGTYSVVVTNNSLGCAATDSWTIESGDEEAPVFTTSCPSNQEVEAPDAYTHSGTDWDMAATDNCVSPTVSYTLSGATSGTGTSLDGVVFNIGTTTVEWTATDGENSSTCSFTVNVNQVVVIPDPVYLDGYCTYRPIEISSPADLGDYQVELTIPYDEKMNSDFSDLRFTLEDGTVLSYWVEDYTASSTATVWVKVPDLLSGASYIFMFYGNGSATSQSSIDNTLNPGLLLRYYTYPGGSSPDESTWTLRSICSDNNSPINYFWGGGSANLCGESWTNLFVLRWTGYLKSDGGNLNVNYLSGSDDGHRVWVDNNLVVDDWNDQSHSTNAFNYSFSADENVLPFQFDMYENGGDASAEMKWDTNGGTNYTTIPKTNYFHSTYTETPPTATIGAEENHEIDLSFGSPDVSVCPGESITYTLEDSYDSYSWTVSGGSVSAGGGSSDNSVTVTWGSGSSGSVDVMVTSGGCSENLTHGVAIIQQPNFTAPEDQEICLGESVDLELQFSEKSVYFDGSGDYIHISDANDINIGSHDKRTVAFWFNAEATGARQVLFEEGGNVNGFAAFIDGGKLYVHAWESNTTWGEVSTSVSTGWNHVAFVFDNDPETGENFKGFLNGNYIGGQNDPAGDGTGMNSHSGDINIAQSDGSLRYPDNSTENSHNYFKGYIDEFKMWNSALSEEEIRSEMYRVHEGSDANQIVYFNFNDDSGNTVTSETGDNNGTIQGNATHSGDTPFTPSVSWSPGGMSGVSITVTPTETTTYTYTISSQGCSSNGAVTVTVSDIETTGSTTINESCPDQNNGSIDLVVSGGIGSYSYNWTTTDGSGLVTTDEDQSGLAPGTYTVTITDQNGCTKDASFTINEAIDNVDPELTCPDDIDVNVDPEQCYAVVNYTPPVGTDNCPGVTTRLVSGLTSGSQFPVGVTTNTYEAEDAYGNKEQCSFNVTVTGNEAPRIDCPTATVSLLADNNSCSTTYNWENELNIESCNGYSLNWTRDDGVVADAEKFDFTVGTTVVNVTATDDVNGKQTSCQFTVFVDENPDNPPTITAPGDVTVSCDDAVPAPYNLAYFESNGWVADNCGYENASFDVEDVSVNNPDGSRTITRTYSISDYAGNEASNQQVITVTNDQEVNAAITIVPGCTSELLQISATIGGFTAPSYQWQRNQGSGWMNFDGASTGDPLVFETNTHNENDQFRLMVSEGGCTSYSSPVTVIYDDQEKPVFDASLDFNRTLCVPNGQTTGSVTGIGLTNVTQVSDNCTSFGDLTIIYSVTGATVANSSATGQNNASNVNFNEGTSTVVYTVTDESGNSETYSFNIEINQEPALNSISSSPLDGAPGTGTSPYQCSAYRYWVENTPEAGFTYEWTVWQGTNTDPSSGTQLSAGSDYTITTSGSYNDASIRINWLGNLVNGTYTLKVEKTAGNGCSVEETLTINLQNNFNTQVDDPGNDCKGDAIGPTVVEWTVLRNCGGTSWSFDWYLFKGDFDTFPGTGSSALVSNNSFLGITGNEQTVNTTIDFADEVFTQTVYTLFIRNQQDSNGQADINSADDHNKFYLKGIPNTSEISTD